ncbi:sulfotransferase [Nocardiopsis alba]
MTTALIDELHHPDPAGIDLALFRTRMYRFSDNPRHYALAEVLEERFIDGSPPSKAMLDHVSENLNSIRNIGAPLPFAPILVAEEGIDIEAELRARSPFTPKRTQNPSRPDQVICILGAPRSGTSHLHNLLARTGGFAYFTTVTCWAWPARNLGVPQRKLFESMPDDVLCVDNKATRIIPGLVMPYEAEDIYARAIPTYRHRQGHTYDIVPASIGDAHLLRHAIGAHTEAFGRQRFLTKSPFNALRIQQIEQILGPATRYIHIDRPREQVAASLVRNRFVFHHGGRELSPEQAYDLFDSAIQTEAPSARTRSVSLEELREEPSRTIADLLAWLDSDKYG